jgi:hypothetical protein
MTTGESREMPMRVPLLDVLEEITWPRHLSRGTCPKVQSLCPQPNAILMHS